MDRDTIAADPRPRRLQWLALTVPCGPLALFAYGAFEWLFFLTKPSPVSVLPWADRLLVLLLATVPFLTAVLLAQLVASMLSLVAFPRLRNIALVPAAAILAALVLILADNFFYALFKVSAITASVARPFYGAVLLGAFALWLWKLAADLWCARSLRRLTLVLWVCVAPLLALAVRDLSGPGWHGSPELPAVAAANRKNVLLLSIDGIDAARLSAYGSPRDTSPFLASLVPESLLCENAFSDAAQTYGSLASLLTGRSPITTKVIVPPSLLRGGDAWLHLPGILNRSGYRTLQLSMRHFADADDANLLGGFDRANYRWENRLSTLSAETAQDRARTFRLAAIDRLDSRIARIFGSRAVGNEFAHVTGQAIDPFWSDARRIDTLLSFVDEGRAPWFAHVHFLDTHAGGHREQQVLHEGAGEYEQALLNADRHVRLIFEALTRRGQLDDTIVVITSDHGAGWTTTERIPLMIRFPQGRHTRRVTRNVSNLDVAPTILEALGVTPPEWMEGTSLLDDTRHPRRPRVAIAASGPPIVDGWFTIPVPRAPNHGARALSVIIGSSWYAIDLASGQLSTGPVRGHTRAAPAAAPAHALRILENAASDAGFRIGTAGSGSRPREVQHARP